MQDKRTDSFQAQVEVIKAEEGQPKQPFTEPRLTFIEPKLVKHGDVADVTAGFFGAFYP